MAEALECLDDFKGKFPEQANSSACNALDKDIKAALFSKTESGMKLEFSAHTTDLHNLDSPEVNSRRFSNSRNCFRRGIYLFTPADDKKANSSVRFHSFSRKESIPEDELVLRERSFDYKHRYCGHCNTTTDIKEANFFGRWVNYSSRFAKTPLEGGQEPSSLHLVSL